MVHGFSLRHWPTSAQWFFFFPPAKSKAARFIGLPPPPPIPTPSAAPCPLTSTPCAGQMVLQSMAAAICGRIWGYERVSLCVCRLFTDSLPDGPTHSMCCVWNSWQQDSNWMCVSLTAPNRWLEQLNPEGVLRLGPVTFWTAHMFINKWTDKSVLENILNF